MHDGIFFFHGGNFKNGIETPWTVHKRCKERIGDQFSRQRQWGRASYWQIAILRIRCRRRQYEYCSNNTVIHHNGHEGNDTEFDNHDDDGNAERDKAV